jgi:hypothetical protein
MINIIESIIRYLPNIDSASVAEIVHIVNESNNFGNFRNNEIPDCQFELAFANYIGTGNKHFVDYYKQIVVEGCFAEFMEWYEYLTKHILRKDVQEALGLSFDTLTSDWVLAFKQSDLIGWAYQLSSVDVFVANIDKVIKIGDIMTNFFNHRKTLSILDQDYFESDHAQLVLDSIRSVIANNNYQELEHQLHSDKVLCMIEVYGWSNRFNPILLEWVYENKNKVKAWC